MREFSFKKQLSWDADDWIEMGCNLPHFFNFIALSFGKLTKTLITVCSFSENSLNIFLFSFFISISFLRKLFSVNLGQF